MPNICHLCQTLISRTKEQIVPCGAIFHRTCLPADCLPALLDRLANCTACAPTQSTAKSVPCPSSYNPALATPTSLKRKGRDSPTPPSAPPPTTRRAPTATTPTGNSTPRSSPHPTYDTPPISISTSSVKMSGGDDMPAWFDRWQKSSFAPSLANISLQFSTINSSINKVDERVSEIQQNWKDTMDGVKCLREDLGGVINDVNILKESVTRNSLDIATVKSAETKLSELVSALDSKIVGLERNLSAAAPAGSTSLNDQYDACEVLISGFPPLPTLSSISDEVNALLAKMKLPDFRSSILKVRTWEPKGPNRDAATGQAQQSNSRANKSRSLVIRVANEEFSNF